MQLQRDEGIESMLTIGCHLSASDGFLAMAEETVRIGGNTFQFFTRNPRGGRAKDLDQTDVSAFLTFCASNGIRRILAHAPYTLNPAAKEDRILEFTEDTMRDDLLRMEAVPGNYYNFHPGSHVGQGTEEGVRRISGMLNRILLPNQSTTVLLETMSGKGSEVGGRFEELQAIIERVDLSDKIGVCLDTCHVSDAGYDIIHSLDEVLSEFDRVVGIDRLRAIHINDSKNPPGSHKDRHEKIGEGYLGLDTFRKILSHPSLSGLPFYLETPQPDNDGYAKEIALLRQQVSSES